MPLRPARFPTKRPHWGKKARSLAKRGKFRDVALNDPKADKVILEDGVLFIKRTVPSAATVVPGPWGRVVGRGATEASGSVAPAPTPGGSTLAAVGLLGSWGSVASSLPPLATGLTGQAIAAPALHTSEFENQIPPHRHTRRASLLIEPTKLRSGAVNPLSPDALAEMRSKRAQDPTTWSTTALSKHFNVSRHFVSMAAPLGRPASRHYVGTGESRASNLSEKSLERAKTLEWEDDTRRQSWGTKKSRAREERQRRREQW